MAEFDSVYAKKGQGNAALTLGIIGTGLAALGNSSGNGLLSGIFGGNGGRPAVDPGYRISEKQDEKIDFLQNELMKERCERYTDQKICDLKSLMYDKFESVNSSLCAQNVWNATNTSTINCLTNQLNQISSLLTYGIASDKVISSTTVSTTA